MCRLPPWPCTLETPGRSGTAAGERGRINYSWAEKTLSRYLFIFTMVVVAHNYSEY